MVESINMIDSMKLISDDYAKNKEKLVKANFPKGFVAFGSARISMDDQHIKEINEVACLCAKRILTKKKNISFITGGGPSVMTAWLEGAYKAGGKTGGMALLLPHEKENEQLKFCDKDSACIMKTFESRKALMYDYAKALIIFKGGFGTMDELFSALTFIKTKKMPEVPILVYPSDFYKDVLNFKTFVKAKTIEKSEYDIIKFMNSKEELLDNLYNLIDNDN
jgi:uncharacterized protein (TIGR00730 family)